MFNTRRPLVLMKGITKRFPGVLALDNVDFEVEEGEIHGLLGENGAGKTTLMNILYGIYKPDNGEIFVKGRKVVIRDPKDAIRLGIGMVPQHFRLVTTHTVVENVILGMKEYGFIIRYKEATDRIKNIGSKYGFKVNPNAKIWQLTTGEKQYVELLKVLMRDVKVLILDEPTTVLTPYEVDQLFYILKRMRDENKSIIFITHKLREALSLCDRVTVLRKGRVMGTVKPEETSEVELAKMMIGDEITFKTRRVIREASNTPILEVRDLNVLNDKGVLAVKNISFKLCSGEILGIAGVTGSGQEELAEALVGLRKPLKGRIIINDYDVTYATPKKIFELGVAYIPKDRVDVGVLTNLTIWENMILRHHRYPPIRKDGMLLDVSKARSFTMERVKEYDIALTDICTPARTLSGGNLQKLILARELAETSWRKIKLIIAVHPTRGLDVKAAEYVRRVLLNQRDKGSGVLLISEDLEEVLTLSDRIAVMYNGVIVGIVPTDKVDINEIGLMMSGSLRKS